MDTREFDLVVIGAGPVGENIADRAVRSGLTAAIIESELVGGECSYWACMPSKAMLRPGDAIAAARSVHGAREAVTGAEDIDAVFARRDAFTHDWSDDSQVAWLHSAGIELVRGRGRIIGERHVVVTRPDHDDVHVRARYAVAVATGSAALVPDIPGLAALDPWTSREATSTHEIPASLAVIGGGVVACEMATFFARAGSAVTLITPGRLLSRLEPHAGDAVARGLSDLGVRLVHGRVESANASRDGAAQVNLDDGATVAAERILVATGRRPRTDDLGLDTVDGARLHDGDWLSVDDTMLVRGTDWLYAVGDVNHRALLTHQGKYQARAAGDAIAARAHGERVDDAPWGTHVATADHHAVAQVIFTDPPVAAVGATATEAEKAGLSTRVIDYDLGSIAGAATFADGYRGHGRVVIDTSRDTVIGVTLIGPGVEEMIHAATIAIVGAVPIERLWHAVPAYPTISEVWLRWLEEYGRPAPTTDAA